jgi:multidrug efflux pump subunit AcrA (membrane-fusion protein)
MSGLKSAVVIACLSVLLVACNQQHSRNGGSMTDAAPQSLMMEMAPAEATPLDAGPPSDTSIAVSAPQLAYDYDYSFVVRASGLEPLVAAHQKACDAAGPATCQMISRRGSNNKDASSLSRTLELRVTPAWLKTWQSSLDQDIKKAGGRISQHSVQSQDLSLQIVDTEARLKNKEALRDRLAEIVRSRPGKISDLVEAETQLAQVQADIDAARSSLAVMRKRVATVHLTLTYESEAVAASSGTFAPLGDAMNSFVSNMVWALASLIHVIAAAIPFVLAGLGAFWLVRWWWKRRKKKPQPGDQ